MKTAAQGCDFRRQSTVPARGASAHYPGPARLQHPGGQCDSCSMLVPFLAWCTTRGSKGRLRFCPLPCLMRLARWALPWCLCQPIGERESGRDGLITQMVYGLFGL